MLTNESPATSSHFLGVNKEAAASSESQHDALVVPTESGHVRRAWYKRKSNILLLIVLVIVVLFLAIFLPLFFTVIRRHIKTNVIPANSGTSSGSGKPAPTSAPTTSGGVTTGGDGSIVKLANGTEFTYRNPFGGFWVVDPSNPFNNNAQPNSWTPPLNTSWTWGVDRVYGVNLGGWLVLEPFITPDIFQRYPSAVDEFTLSQAMAADTANGGLQQLEDHYNTFVTEQDVAEMAGAGLNWIRVPLPFWAVETWPGEPFLSGTSWKYFVQFLGWARKYGMRICLDLHAVPGSQNGFNHSGRLSFVSWMASNMGIANAERTLYYLRVITEFISQPQYRDVVPVFGIVNEALLTTIGMDQLTSFYLEAHTIIRDITGLGAGNGPYIAIGDGFQSHSLWSGFLQGSDRIILDEHPYFAFGGVDTDPIAVVGDQGILGGKWPFQACNTWASDANTTRGNFGVLIAGEFSASPNDCGLFLRGVGVTSPNPQCDEYTDYANYNSSMTQGLLNFVMAQYDSFGDWFFWTWKIGPSQAGVIESPGWSYQLGLQQGWIPKDPRTAAGTCALLGVASNPFDGTYQPWQTGTPSSIPAISTQQFPWPPASIVNADVPVSLLPTYTATGPITTLPPATFTGAPSSVTQSVNGWFDPQDTVGGITTVAGCPYPDEYTATFNVIPTAPCPGPGSSPTVI